MDSSPTCSNNTTNVSTVKLDQYKFDYNKLPPLMNSPHTWLALIKLINLFPGCNKQTPGNNKQTPGNNKQKSY